MHRRRLPGGHKQFCLTPKQHTPAAAQEVNTKGAAVADNECTICIEDLDAEGTMTLKCSHRFHAKCSEVQKQ